MISHVISEWSALWSVHAQSRPGWLCTYNLAIIHWSLDWSCTPHVPDHALIPCLIIIPKFRWHYLPLSVQNSSFTIFFKLLISHRHLQNICTPHLSNLPSVYFLYLQPSKICSLCTFKKLHVYILLNYKLSHSWHFHQYYAFRSILIVNLLHKECQFPIKSPFCLVFHSAFER